MHKSTNPAGKGGVRKQIAEALTSVQASDYVPKAAISSLSVYNGRRLIGFLIQFREGIHCVDARGQSLGIFESRKAAIESLTATVEVLR